MSEPLLLPRPRELRLTGGQLGLSRRGVIAVDVQETPELRIGVQQLQDALGAQWVPGPPPAEVRLGFDSDLGVQEYQLTVTSEGIELLGGDSAGVFHGVQTLRQLLATARAVPCLEIRDWPDLPVRGVMLDISRDKVPTQQTLFELVDLLASWKVNQLQLYMEHTFAYERHPLPGADASPVTAAEVRALDAYCRERFVELVPNQNSFGHMHRWLKHPPYASLAETGAGVTLPWGEVTTEPWTLSPGVPGSLELLAELYDELLPNFTSGLFNVGCDEVFDLGQGRSADLVAARGKDRVYLDFVLGIQELVRSRGRTMQFWGDMIKRAPQVAAELPKDLIVLDWGYEAERRYDLTTRLFAEAGLPFYVCPGTSSWTSIAGRTTNTLGNIRNAVQNGLDQKAAGVLVTDWGDRGHWQQLPVSYLGFAYAAATSWGFQTNADLDVTAALDAFAFRDSARVMGKLVSDLGDAYLQPGYRRGNSSMLFWSYMVTVDHVRQQWLDRMVEGREVVTDDAALIRNMHATLEYVDAAVAPLESARMNRPDARLIQEELAHTARMLRHGARRVLFQVEPQGASAEELLAELLAIEAEHRRLWVQRNRPGGLEDSAAGLTAARALYE